MLSFDIPSREVMAEQNENLKLNLENNYVKTYRLSYS
jgi:hypothetical protein